MADKTTSSLPTHYQITNQMVHQRLTVAVVVEQRAYLWREKAAEDQSLSVELVPAINGPGSKTRDVCSVRVFGLKVKV